MAAQAVCDCCTAVVEKVLCENHAEVKCDACQRSVTRLICEDCAEDEFGEEPDLRREAGEEDVIDLLEQSVETDTLRDLAAALRRRDFSDAEFLLDRLARDVPGWSDAVSLGRYSPQARRAA